MPEGFLTEAQRKQYGSYTGVPSSEQLIRYFTLDEFDRELVGKRKNKSNKLGYALQLCTVRFLGTFLTEPTAVPIEVLLYLASQLNIEEPEKKLSFYGGDRNQWKHSTSIRIRYGYREFHSQPEYFRLTRWLYNRIYNSNERSLFLFDAVTARLIDRKILLPGASVIERLIIRIKEKAEKRFCRKLSACISASKRKRLEKIFSIPEGSKQTELDFLKKHPVKVTFSELENALKRVESIDWLGITELNLSKFPKIRISMYARYAAIATVRSLKRLSDNKRAAVLISWAHTTAKTARDDVIDIFEQLTGEYELNAKRKEDEERLLSLKEYDKAALKLVHACSLLFNTDIQDSDLRSRIFSEIPKDELIKAVYTVNGLTNQNSNRHYERLKHAYPTINSFLQKLVEILKFQAVESSKPVIEALTYLKLFWNTDTKYISDTARLLHAPLSVVPKSWLHLVVEADNRINRKYYTLCVAFKLREALKRRDVFVPLADRWSDPRKKLLDETAWKNPAKIFSLLDKETDPEKELLKLKEELDSVYTETSKRLKSNEALRIIKKEGSLHKEKISLSPLDKLPEPPELIELRASIAEKLPKVDLPNLLLELDAKTGFTNEFTHVSNEPSRIEKDLNISICAVLLAESCNIGLEPFIRENIPALSRFRLEWVAQHYVRSETIMNANARLIEAHTAIPLAQIWGAGDTASADGIRFIVPVSTINAGLNRKYFGSERGITYYNFTSDQYTGFHGIVVPGTMRDSFFCLEGLLENETVLNPKELMTDTHGSSNTIFGLFYLLGYRFSPRLADLHEQRFWRFDFDTHYGELEVLARNKVNTKLIADNWNDMIKVAGSLKLGTVKASEIMRILQQSAESSSLAKAIAELGKVLKTIYLLTYIDDADFRRRILTQLNRGEERHKIARLICYGNKGQIRKAYRETQESQLSALGLVINCIVLWNTLYMQYALDSIQSVASSNAEYTARLSPLLFSHINIHGKYFFHQDEFLANGVFRPLRTIDNIVEQ
jgi:TnpA family transposase